MLFLPLILFCFKLGILHNTSKKSVIHVREVNTLVLFLTSTFSLFLQALTIHDTEKCKAWDLGTNFFLCEDDVVNMRNRYVF